MAKLHVIYDPTEKLQTQHVHLPKEIKVSVVYIKDDITSGELDLLVHEVTNLLLDQIR